MSATHKNQYSTLRLSTSLPPDQVAQIASAAAEKVKSSIPGRPFVRFEGATPGQLQFSVRSMGGHMELMTFVADVTASGEQTTATTRIEAFKTTQEKLFMFIPVSPKTLVGYGEYKRFAATLLADLTAVDASTTGSLVERPNG